MSHVVVSEAFLTVAAVIIISVFTAVVVGSVHQLRDVQALVTRSMSEEMMVGVKIVFANAEEGSSTVKVWVKNVGLSEIPGGLIGRGDLFFGPAGAATRIPYNATAPPTWSFRIANDVDGDGRWDKGETIEVTIQLDYTITQGDYYVRYVAYTGCYSEYSFSV